MDKRHKTNRSNQKRTQPVRDEQLSSQPRFTDTERKYEDAKENHTRGGF